GAPDDRLRDAECRANVVHMLPSRAMLADALAQYLIWKRWSEWLLVVGTRVEDRLFADAVRRAAKRFGAKIVAEKVWEYGPDARRTAQAEIPVFTQGVDYDVLIVADEIGEFGDYLIYRTWDPKIVAGTQGLVPTMWHWTHEQWGAWQLQRRFQKLAGRRMTAIDHAVWTAVRVIGEAATRAASTDLAPLEAYLRSPEFALAAFKGVPLSFRPWNGQLRQPVLLAAPRALVSVSPQKGFLHQHSELDTLGYDAPETGCQLDQRLP
ncbi:MAG: ABC transporter substrate-binding protein, partial [Proteobacteria bacterium]|nr:ABC transporter substrate-binding protein [Pseudomonadota bacterium]